MSDIAAKLRSIAQDWDSDGELHQALAGAAAELDEQSAELERLREWKVAVEEAAVVNWTLNAENADNPRKAISDLICCIMREALDPTCSQPAAELHAKVAALEQQVAASELELAVYRGWRAHIESSHDVDGWAAGFYWKQELEKAQQQVRRHAEDWTSTDTHVRAVAKRFLPAQMVDGDSQGVPPIEDVVDGLELVIDALSDHIDKVEQQVAALRAEIGDPPPGSHPDEAKPRAATWHAERLNWAYEAASLRAELAARRADAERYRWLREDRGWATVIRVVQAHAQFKEVTLREHFLDEAIDAARQA